MDSGLAIRRSLILATLCLFLSHWCVAEPTSVQILQNITIRGNTVFTKSDIENMMKSKRGNPYDPEQFRMDLEAIIDMYHQRGYSYARLDTWFPRPFSDGIYASLKINEGRIGKIEVRGNTRTRTRIILQELLFKPNQLYNEEDRLESERILRKKPNLGDVEIRARFNEETKRVDVLVQVTDRWTLFPSASLPTLGAGELDLILALTDTNIAGRGQMGRIRYERKQEDQDTRHYFSMLFLEPRLFASHWEFMGNFIQNEIGDSWEVRLRRPFYALKSRWAAELSTSDRTGIAKWYRDGSVLDEFRRHSNGQSAGITYALGQRHSYVRISGWYTHRRDDYTPLRPVSEARFEDTEVDLLGTSVLRQRIHYTRDVFVDKMGEVEDVELGSSYGVSIGRSFEFLGGVRNEIASALGGRVRLRVPPHGYLVAGMQLSGSSRDRSWRDIQFSGDVRFLMKDLLYQTLALRLQCKLAFQSNGRRQILLGLGSGLRGYAARAFDGDRLILLNLETRRVFLRHSLAVLGWALFTDIGYIWRSDESFDLWHPKRSIGVGLRVGIPRLSGAPVYRLDFAWALDSREPTSLGKAIIFSMGNMIRIRTNGE